MESEWSEEIDTDAAYRRAGGRRHYDAVRRFIQAHRRFKVPRLLSYKGTLFRRGIQTELARELNVSRSSIYRDIAYLLPLATDGGGNLSTARAERALLDGRGRGGSLRWQNRSISFVWGVNLYNMPFSGGTAEKDQDASKLFGVKNHFTGSPRHPQRSSAGSRRS
jgi:hypothetical protein